MNANLTFTRIEKILDYIHDNIREPLSLEDLAQKSCWSRWQLQRVFQAYTGFSVVQYVREMKLSQAALVVLEGEHRILDIALEFGFNSEISFSRAFKQFFGLSPKRYQLNGKKTGIKTPLTAPIKTNQSSFYPEHTLYQVRLEHKTPFSVYGVRSVIRGLLSPNPDFSCSIPSAWKSFFQYVDSEKINHVPHIGIIDLSSATEEGELMYWAGIEAPEKHVIHPDLMANCQQLDITHQEYAVLPYCGDVNEFHKAVTWLIAIWLPESGYQGVDDAFELEIYYPPFAHENKSVTAEYWLPIAQ